MTGRTNLPAFEIIAIEDASNAVAKRLRVYVAIGPDDMGLVCDVAAEVIHVHGASNDVVMMFFHPSAATAGKAPAEARAQYVRDGMKQGYVPKPMASDLGGYGMKRRMKMPHGVITVETARQAL